MKAKYTVERGERLLGWDPVGCHIIDLVSDKRRDARMTHPEHCIRVQPWITFDEDVRNEHVVAGGSYQKVNVRGAHRGTIRRHKHAAHWTVRGDGVRTWENRLKMKTPRAIGLEDGAELRLVR